jgi:hypothetical protein
VYTPLEVHFSESCWRLLHDDTLPAPLSPELRAVLDLGPKIRVTPPDPSPRYVVTMLRLHAHALVAFLGGVFESLSVDDAKRRDCQRCLEDLGDSVAR